MIALPSIDTACPTAKDMETNNVYQNKSKFKLGADVAIHVSFTSFTHTKSRKRRRFKTKKWGM